MIVRTYQKSTEGRHSEKPRSKRVILAGRDHGGQDPCPSFPCLFVFFKENLETPEATVRPENITYILLSDLISVKLHFSF